MERNENKDVGMGLIVNINWKYGVYLSVYKALCVGT